MTQERRRKRNLIIGSIVAAILGVTVARSVMAGPSTIPTGKDKKASERVEVPAGGGRDDRTDVPKGDYLAGNGVVEPHDRETRVAGDEKGRIAQILVKEGDFVQAGAVLAELDSDAEKAALAAATADLEAHKAELQRTLRGLRKEDVDAIVADTESLKARAELAKSTLARRELLAASGAATQDELDRARRQAETDLKMLEAAEARRRAAIAGSRSEDIAMARARVSAGEARVREAQARVDRLIVRAPITGEVLQVKFRAGEYYQPGTDPLVILGDTRTLRVRMDVDERDVSKLRQGANAIVTSNAFIGRQIPGRVVEVGKRMGRKNIRTDDPVERIDTKILEAVIELENKQGLVPGLRVVAYVEIAK